MENYFDSFILYLKEYFPSIELILKDTIFLGMLILFYFIVSIFSRYLSWKISQELPPEHQYIGRPLHQIFKVVIFIPVMVGFLWWWGIDVSHLVISASLIGGVLLFILRDPVENTMSAFLLIVQYKLKRDQEISIVGPKGSFSGKLIYLDLGHIFLQDKESVYIIPNGTVSKSIIELKSNDAKELVSDCFHRRQRRMVKGIRKKENFFVSLLKKM